MADVKKNYTGSEKLITSDILFQNMKNFDKRRVLQSITRRL